MADAAVVKSRMAGEEGGRKEREREKQREGGGAEG